MIITEKIAWQVMNEQGYKTKSIAQINEGSNHYVFDIRLEDDTPLICKFTKIRESEKNFQKENRDTLFNGRVSLEREAELYKICNSTGLPAPYLYGIYDSEYGKFIVIEKMKGMPYFDYLKKENFKLEKILHSLEALGKDFARLHQLNYSSYGNLTNANHIEPSNITNFADYYLPIADFHLQCLYLKKALTDEEYSLIQQFIHQRFTDLYTYLDITKLQSTYVMSDMHAANYFVDENGIPSGYFDLESSQAAPALFEYYGFEFFLFNMFDEITHQKAKSAFFKGYQENGGRYLIHSTIDQELVDFFSALRLLELAQSYWGVIDGIRDTWGKAMKDLFFYYMDTLKLDYQKVGDIFRLRDLHPKHPN